MIYLIYDLYILYGFFGLIIEILCWFEYGNKKMGVNMGGLVKICI